MPEAIREIKEAVSAEPDMVAQRVRAIVTRHLGPEILSKFFSNSHQYPASTISGVSTSPTVINTSSTNMRQPVQLTGNPSTSRATILNTASPSVLTSGRRTSAPVESECYGSKLSVFIS